MIRKIIPSTDLFRNISTLVVGTFIAQLVPMLLQSILRRMYPAEDFGVYAVFISVTGILMVVASLRYEVAVVLPEKKADAVNLVFAGIILSFLFSLLVLILTWLLEEQLMAFLNIDLKYSFMLYYLSPAVFLFSIYQVINYYLVRYKAYKAVSINKITRRLTEGFLQLVLGFIKKFSTGLIAGNIAGHVANIAAGWIQMRGSGFSTRLFSFKRQIHLLRRYREYPLYNLIPAFLNALCLHMPLIFVNKFFTQQDTAYFDLARQVLILPASILTLSISQVMLQAISEKHRLQKSFTSDLKRIIFMLSLLGAGMVIIILLWGPWLFAIYAGEEYAASGIHAQIIVVGAALKLVVSPLSSIFAGLNRIKWLSLWQAMYFVVLGILLFFRHLDILTFLKVYLVIDIISYGILLLMIISLSRSYEKTLEEKSNFKDE